MILLFIWPRQPTPNYALIDLGPGTVVDLSGNGEVLIQSGNYDAVPDHPGLYLWPTETLWAGGVAVDVPFANDDKSAWYYWTRVADDGEVLGWAVDSFDAGNSLGPVAWDGNVSHDPVSISDEALAGALPDDAVDPYVASASYMTQGTSGLDVATRSDDYYVTANYSVDSGIPGGLGDLYDDYAQILDWGPEGNLSPVGDPILLHGPDTPMANATFTIPLVTDAANDTLEYIAANFSYGMDDSDNYVLNNSTANYTVANTGGNTVVYNAGTQYAFFSYLSAYLPTDGDGQFGNLTNPLLLNPYFGGTDTLYYTSGNTALAADWTTDPLTGNTVNLRTINSLGIGITDDNQLWMNGREVDDSDLLPADVLSGNTSVAFKAISSNTSTAVVAVTTTSGNTSTTENYVIPPICIDPINDNGFDIGANLSTENSVPINALPNPAVIVIDSNTTTTPTILEADVPANLAGNIYWTVDSDSVGSVQFVGTGGNCGSSVQVVGVSSGRVNFTLKFDNGSGPDYFKGDGIGGNLTIDPHHKYEALVANNLNLTCRMQRMTNIGGNASVSPAPDTDNLTAILHLANVFMRQAGITLVLDSNTTIPSGHHYADFGTEQLTNSTVPGIFDVPLSSNASIASNYYGTATFPYVEKFVADNYQSNAVQIAFMGKFANVSLRDGASGLSLFRLGSNLTSLNAYGNYDSTNSTFDLPYITSTNDNDALNTVHYLHVNKFTPSAYLNDLSKFGITYTSSANSSVQDLAGLAILVDAISSATPSTRNYEIANTIAHEMGHTLNLDHRFGHSVSPFDRLEEQPESGPGKYLGDPGTNVMDYDPGPEDDFDLAQVMIMRSNILFDGQTR
ncbi:MAG TPA: hypothetical protein VK737_12935 [Opitutales bacterium]|nr:hypothetical protein [Opitutales bacterium]